MPVLATERWNERFLRPGKAARRTFDVTGVLPTDPFCLVAAIDACIPLGVQPLVFHPQDPLLIIPLGGLNARNEQGTAMYRVEANYEPVGPFGPDPLTLPADITPRFTDSTELIDRDIYGNPITNSARAAFQNVYNRATGLEIIIERWESVFDAALILQYTYPFPTLNSDTVHIARFNGDFLPGQLMIRSICCGKPLKSDAALDPYVRMVYTLEARGFYNIVGTLVNDDPNQSQGISGFCNRILDQGKQGYWKDSSGTERIGKMVMRRVLGDGSGTAATIVEEVSQDERLDGSGLPFDKESFSIESTANTSSGKIVPAQVGYEVTPEGVWLYYMTYKFMPFAALGLPA